MKKLLLVVCVSVVSSQVALGQQTSAKRKRPGPSIVWVNEPKQGWDSLPTGVTHQTFRSRLVDQDIGYCVYQPPQLRFGESSNESYPVLYSLHGNGGNEFTTLAVAEVLERQIEAGTTPPLIMVFPNGGHSTFYKNRADGKFPIESILLNELIPHIDSTMPTIGDRVGRCIEGFSMGGRGAIRLAMKHPKLFCSVFCQAGNVPHLLDTFDQLGVEERETSLLGPKRETWEADDVYAVTTRNQADIKQNVRIQIACGTKDGGHLPTIRDFHAHLMELGIDHTYMELQNLAHKRTEMLAQLGPIWFDSHVTALARTLRPNERF
ncbi:MAG: alpha/beta hydrolase-fold protein [Planctomycetota bacterium]